MARPSFRLESENEGREWNHGTYNCSSCGTELFHAPYHWIAGLRWPSLRTAFHGRVDVVEDSTEPQIKNLFVCIKCGQRLGVMRRKGKLCGEDTIDASRRFCMMSSFLTFHRSDRP